MKNWILALAFLAIATTSWAQQSQKTLFAYGGQVQKGFIEHVITLTGKENPKICFLPTATGDRATYINYWYELCRDLPMVPYVQRVWISSYAQDKTFEEVLTGMDAIVVGGGNTLNMLAIWEAQGIDKALVKAYENGTVLAGGSAGSLCWFKGGTTDSRPVELSIVQGLGILDYSHCPHYSYEESRRPLYHENILSGKLQAGYACDDKAGIVFLDGKFDSAVSLDAENHSYYVYKKNGKVVEERLESRILK